jgi:hypothetical protein
VILRVRDGDDVVCVAGVVSDVTVGLEGLSASGLAVVEGSRGMAAVRGSKDTFLLSKDIADGDTAKASLTLRTPRHLERSVVLPVALRSATGVRLSCIDAACRLCDAAHTSHVAVCWLWCGRTC